MSSEQLEAVLDSLPMSLMFVDENERLVYRNKNDQCVAGGAPDVTGQDIRDCHKETSLPRLEQIVTDFKSGDKDEEGFWMVIPDRRIFNRFLAVRNKDGKYLGMIEYLVDFTAMEELAEAKKDAYVSPRRY